MKRIFALAALAAMAFAGTAKADIVVTEVGYDAPGTDTVNEYAVLFNNGPGSQDLSGWSFDDVTGGGGSPLDISGAGILGAGAYLVIGGNQGTLAALETAWASTVPSGATVGYFNAGGNLPALNNGDGDDVNLIDDMSMVHFNATYADNATTGEAVELSSGSSNVVTPFSTIVGIPEPASASLLALGSLALIRRRRS